MNSRIIMYPTLSRTLIKKRMKKELKKDILCEPTGVSSTAQDKIFMDGIKRTIEAHIDNPNFSVDDLCDEFGMHRKQLDFKLKKITGTSTVAFVRSIKMKRAAQLILLRQNTINEIVEDIGYRDLKHFRNNFKSFFGVNPSEYTGMHVSENTGSNVNSQSGKRMKLYAGPRKPAKIEWG